MVLYIWVEVGDWRGSLELSFAYLTWMAYVFSAVATVAILRLYDRVGRSVDAEPRDTGFMKGSV